ncbi:MAG TPA: branched-chain amino acid ABC transporter permease [Dehalococcoidales bacterium]
MTFFVQLVVAGISLGMIYALIALGFVIILKCSAAFNIAQGHFVMLGGYLGFTFLVQYHWPLWLSIILAVAIAVVMGLTIERLALRPLLGQPVLAVVMMTVALANVLGGVATLIWGGIFKSAYSGVLPGISLKIGSVSLPPESFIGLVVSAVVVIALMLIFRFTKAGLAMRATAEDEQVVRSSGIRVTTVYALAWVIACVVGVVSGILLGGIVGADVSNYQLGLAALPVVILGGLDSLGGAVIAGLILGILQNIAAGYLDPLMTSGGTSLVFPYVVMIIVLIFKPYGLFGLKRIERI